MKYLAIIVLASGMFIAIFIWAVSAGLFGQLPDDAQLTNISNNVASEIYSADSVLIGQFYLQERTNVTSEDISPVVFDALIATEDVRYYEHHGIDIRSLFRVFFKSILLRNNSGGGSTISQQLVKNIFPRTNFGLLSMPVVKVKESLVARRLEDIFTKKDILVLYLNTVPFGDNVFGIEEASRLFFNKPAARLNTQEAAVLIGMLKANYSYNPRVFPQASLGRRNVVLSQMNKYGYLNDNQYDSLSSLPLQIDYQGKSAGDRLAPYFKDQVRKKLLTWVIENPKSDGTPYNIYTEGLKIYTTINARLQAYARKAMQDHMKLLQKEFDRHWGRTKPWQQDPEILEFALSRFQPYRKMQKQGMTEKAIMDSLSKPHPVELFSWDGPVVKNISTLDSLKYYLDILHAGVLAMDSHNGDIKAWVGGIDYDYFKYDHVQEFTKRQVGSTFKPFIYAAALENGEDPCEYISGARTTYADFNNWSPNNADTSENLLSFSFKGALAKSVNTVAVKVLEMTGIQETIELAEDLGISSKLPELPSLALGTADISLYEMVRAYSVFADSGFRVTPRIITAIADEKGNLLAEFNTEEPEQVISESTAMMITNMLEAVVDSGTASRIRTKYHLTNALAGKTGTTQSNADGWFIGYNPDLTIGVWVGADDPRVRFRSTALGQGASMALPIFAGIFREIDHDPQFKQLSEAEFPPLPDELAEKMDCDNWEEDKTFLEDLFGIDKTEQVKTRDFGKKKQNLFQRIGSWFKRKKKKNK